MMPDVVEAVPGVADAASHYPDLRGSAAAVPAVPQPDIAMSAGPPKSEAPTAEDIAGKRQKKEIATLENVDPEPLPDDFKANIVTADDGLSLTQTVRSVEAIAVKHHAAVVLFRDTLRAQERAHSKLEARLRAMLSTKYYQRSTI
jgi:hypothetical protein